MLGLDHIVCVVADLEEASDFFAKQLGVKAQYGGKHESLGTHNALVGLGQPEDKQYLELLAIDKSVEPRLSYPLGADLSLTAPKTSTWALQCNDITKTSSIFREYGDDFDQGEPYAMSRYDDKQDKTYHWQIAYHENCYTLTHGTVPFLIDWGQGEHPCDQLSEENFCRDFHLLVNYESHWQLDTRLQEAGFVSDKVTFESSTASGLQLTLQHDGVVCI